MLRREEAFPLLCILLAHIVFSYKHSDFCNTQMSPRRLRVRTALGAHLARDLLVS